MYVSTLITPWRSIVAPLFILASTFSHGDALKVFLNHPSLKTSSIGIHMMKLDDGEKLVSHHAELGLIPASTLKAVTTATALQQHGPNYQFTTRLFLAGDDLIIKGGGDPTLSATHPTVEFPAWLAALQEAGLSELKGHIITNDSHFESRTTPNSWPWGDIGNYYGAGPSGLNYHKNSYTLTFQSGAVGQRAKLIFSDPTPPNVTFQNHMLTGTANSGDQGYAYVSPGGNVISLRGTIPAVGKFSIKGALPNPPLSCGMAFHDYLIKNNFPVSGEVKNQTHSPDPGRLIHTQSSPKLSVLIKATNHRSVNLYADCIFKSLSSKGTTEAAQKTLRQHWEEQGVDMTGCVIHDGSGLSPRNTITALQLATIVKLAATGKHKDLFLKSLPVAGQSGTLKYFGRQTAISGNVKAKSGGLTRVTGYTGLFTTRSREQCAFAILTNNTLSNPKPAIAKFLSTIVLEN